MECPDRDLRILRTVATGAVATLLIACGGGDPAAPLDDVGLYTKTACPDLDFASTAGVTLEEIPIGNVPTSFQAPVSAALDVTDEGQSGFAHLTTADDGSLLLSVPLHPKTPLDGGPVTLTLTDGDVACEPVDFTISPLPAADGELDATVDLLQASLAEQAAVLGTTPDELRSTAVDDMAPSLWPLAVTQALLDHPSNDVSLRSIAQGALGSEPLDWIDRLLARTGLREDLEALAEAPAPATAPSRSVEGLLCEADLVTNGERLDFCMSKAAEIARSVAGRSREVAEDVQQVFGDLAENGLPAAAGVKEVFAAMFWVIYAQREAEASLLPSYFIGAEASADPVELMEDDETQGELVLDVTAANLGYDMKGQLIDGLKQAMSLADEAGGFDFSTGTELDDAVDAIAPQFEDALRDLEIDDLNFESELFPVSLFEATWVDSRVISGDAVTVVDGVTFEGNASGTATVSVRTKDGEFGGQQVAAQLSLGVSEIQVHVSPTDVVLGAGDVKTFDVTVSNSAHPDMVAVQPPPAQGEAGLTPGAEGHHYVTYVAPAEPDVKKPDLLTVEHTASTGARKSGAPPRNGTATIRFASITLAPVLDCVGTGEQKQLETTIEGIDGDPELVWTYSAGTVSQSGLFTAPDEPGSVDVTVALADNPDIEDSITIDVGICVCSFSVTIGANPTYTGQPGDTAWYNAYNVGSATGAIGTIEFDAPNASFVLVVELPTTIVTGPGSYPLDDAAGGLGYGGADDFVYAKEGDTGTLTIFEYEQHTKLTGEFSGVTHDGNDRMGPAIPYQGSFQIYPEPGPTGPAGTTGSCGVTATGP